MGLEGEAKTLQLEQAQEHHLQALQTLHQEPWEKTLLNGLLAAIIALALVCYVAFSINPFSADQVKEIQQSKLVELGFNFTL